MVVDSTVDRVAFMFSHALKSGRFFCFFLNPLLLRCGLALADGFEEADAGGD